MKMAVFGVVAPCRLIPAYMALQPEDSHLQEQGAQYRDQQQKIRSSSNNFTGEHKKRNLQTG
jgi:hypothetical protein